MPLVTIEVAEPSRRRSAWPTPTPSTPASPRVSASMPADRFQVIHPLPASHIIADPHFLGGDRRDVVYVRIQMVRMYDTATKNRMYEAVARRLEAEGVRPDDVFIAVTENTLEDWYPGARGKRG